MVYSIAESDDAESVWADLSLAELPAAAPLLDATPAWTHELPSPNITIKRVIAIRFISLLLQFPGTVCLAQDPCA
jgi:hypothetical protein